MGNPLMVVKRALPCSSRFTPLAEPIGFSGDFSKVDPRVFSAHCRSDGDGWRPWNTSLTGLSATVPLFCSLEGLSAIRKIQTLHHRRCVKARARNKAARLSAPCQPGSEPDEERFGSHPRLAP